jgi:hypothetical protein
MTAPTTLHDEALLAIEDAVAWFAERGVVISEQTIRRDLRLKNMPGRKVGKRWLLSVPALRAWLGIDQATAAPSDRPSNLVVIPMLHRRVS